MKVKVLAKADESMRLLLEDIEPAYANALRRVLVSDVPKMAIEDVEFHLGPIRADDGKEYESVGPLFDEMIARPTSLCTTAAKTARRATAKGVRTARSSTP